MRIIEFVLRTVVGHVRAFRAPAKWWADGSINGKKKGGTEQ
jgi:hypothetical protein